MLNEEMLKRMQVDVAETTKVNLALEDNAIISYAKIGNIENSIEHDFKCKEKLEQFEESFKPFKYLYIDGAITTNPNYEDVSQEELQHNQIATEVAILKSQLAETDYRIIKCHEYNLVGMELPYDIQQLHEEREGIREQIREKETLI